MIQVELNELEKQKIEQFCSDRSMYDAVRRVMLAGIYTSGTVNQINPQENAAFHLAALAMQNPIPDAEIGAHVRAMWAGINHLKNAYDALDEIKSTKPEAILSPYNEAE
jgi:hypothetical protein